MPYFACLARCCAISTAALVSTSAFAATMPAEAIAIEGETLPESGDRSLTTNNLYSSGTTPSGQSVVAASRSNVSHALTVAGQEVWLGNGGNNPQFSFTALVPAVRSADLFAVHVREPDLPSYGFRVETAAGILATETLPITELDDLVPSSFAALRWAGDDTLLVLLYAASATNPAARGVLLSSDGSPGSMQWVLGPGDTIDGHDVATVRDIDTSHDGAHRIVLFEDAEGVEHLLVDDSVVIDEDATIPGLEFAWGRTETMSIGGGGRYASGGGFPLNDALQYVAVSGEIVVTAGETLDGIDLTDARIVDVQIDDEERLVHHWRYLDQPDQPETMMYSCDAGAAGTRSRLLLQTGDVIEIQGEPGGTVTVEDFADRYQGDMLGDPNAIVVQVSGQRNGEDVNAAVRLPIVCCGNGDTDPTEGCDDANDVETDACLSTCVAATCGDGFVHDGVEDCDDGNTDDGDGCSSTCEIEEDGTEDSGESSGDTPGTDGPESSSGSSDDGPGDGSATGGEGGRNSGGDSSGGEGGAADGGGGGGGCHVTVGGRDTSGFALLLLALGWGLRRKRDQRVGG